ncbi:MAG TPA: type I 3-dehydroquinate dehydratase, partial [Sphaerochaeta sp.]|nr:type I 3-dehydroquinate dehydratase [Sphaerochaeta sp.]
SLAAEFPTQTDLPLILSFRRQSDGGGCAIGERARLASLFAASRGAWAYVEIEEDVKKSELRFKGAEDKRRIDLLADLASRDIVVIRSSYDTSGVPADIYGRIMRLSKEGAIPKLVAHPTNLMDVITLFRVEKELATVEKKIIVATGPWAKAAQILYRRCGSLIGYATPTQESGGVFLDAQSLSELYRADQIDRRTHIYGMIGNPLIHEATCRIYNPGFVAIRYNAVYVPFLVDQVRTFFKLAELLQIRGFSVTGSHTRSVLPYLGKISREVKQIGSCNTVVRIKSMWKGINTAYYGFLAPISDAMTQEEIKHALVIGSGNAARAVVWALHNHGVKITILNRSSEPAHLLASQTMSTYDTLESAHAYSESVDLVVQASSVPATEMPIPSFRFSGKEIAYELAYEDSETAFLIAASSGGARVLHGKEMFLAQTKLQFEAFTGYHYPHWIAVALND